MNLGLVYTAQKIARIAVSPAAGVWVDSHNRKRVVVYSDVAAALVSLATALAIVAPANVNLSVVLVGVLALVGGVIDAVFKPATRAILPELVEQDMLPRANSIQHFSSTWVGMVAFAAAGLIVALIGPVVAILANAASYFLSAFSESFISYHYVTDERSDAKESYLRRVVAGLHYVTSRRTVLGLAISAGVLNFLYTPLYSVLIYYLFRNIDLGLESIETMQGNVAIPASVFFISISAGNLVGALLPKPKGGPHTAIIRAAALFTLSVVLVFGMTIPRSPVSIQIALLAVGAVSAGSALALFNITATSLFQAEIDTAYAGRFFSFLTVFTQSLGPLGVLLFSAAGAAVPVRYLYVVGACLSLFVTIGLVKFLSPQRAARAAKA